MAAVPSTGRADQLSRETASEADATRALYERYANQIFGYCLHQLGSREEAEDAVQSTFLNAFRGLKRGVVPEMESAWLFKIAHNVCLSRRRSTWRRGRIESPADFELVEEMAPAPARRHDELIGLQDVLETMPDNQRRAILLREWQGLSYREIADELDLSQAAVETLIFRARRSLASGLEQPPETVRRRVRRAAGDLGNVLAGIKSMLLGSAAAVKVAATVAVISATTVVAAAPVQSSHHHAPPKTPSPAPASVGAGAGGPALSPVTGQQGAAPATGPAGRRAGHRVPPLSAVRPFAPSGSPAVADGGTTATDVQAPVTAPADQQTAQQPSAPASAPTQSAPQSAPSTSGDSTGTTTKKQVDTTQEQSPQQTTTTVSSPLSQAPSPLQTTTNSPVQSSGGGSSSQGSTPPASTTPTTTTTTPTSAPRIPVTTAPPSTGGGGSSSGSGSAGSSTGTSTTTPTAQSTTVTGGPLSQRIVPPPTTTPGAPTSPTSSSGGTSTTTTTSSTSSSGGSTGTSSR